MIELKEKISSGIICNYILETGIETKLPLSDPEGYIDNISVPASANEKSLHFNENNIVIGVNRINTRYAKLLFAKIFWDIIGMDMVKKPVSEYGWELTDPVLWGGNVHAGQYNCIGGWGGYGYVWDHSRNEYIRVPHLGQVVISDNVTIHDYVTIDRGTLANTIIGAGTKIGSHVHIDHDVVIGKNCRIDARSTIGGSARLGNNVGIGRGSDVGDCEICDGASIDKMSNVLDGEIVGPNEVWAGNPAKYVRKRRDDE